MQAKGEHGWMIGRWQVLDMSWKQSSKAEMLKDRSQLKHLLKLYSKLQENPMQSLLCGGLRFLPVPFNLKSVRVLQDLSWLLNDQLSPPEYFPRVHLGPLDLKGQKEKLVPHWGKQGLNINQAPSLGHLVQIQVKGSSCHSWGRKGNPLPIHTMSQSSPWPPASRWWGQRRFVRAASKHVVEKSCLVLFLKVLTWGNIL